MLQFMQKKSTKILLHTIIWLVVLMIITSMPMRPEESFSLHRNLPFITTYLFLVIFFYLNAYILTIKLIPDKKIIYILVILAIFFLYLLLHKYIFSLFISQMDHFSPPKMIMRENLHFRGPENGISIRQLVVPFIQYFLFWMVSTCYRLFIEWLSANKRNKEIEAEKSVIELAYLKAQINPHFFFNTLNTIYSLVLNKSDKATEAILLFSQIIRYVLDKVDTDLVCMDEEIDYITNYINLQTLRFTDSLKVEFKTEGNIEDHKIVPLIFISFIENAFQYGVSNHYPSAIFIYMKASEEGIYFILKNKKYKNKELHIGKNIGIKNTKRKLNLIYPDKHKLSVTETLDTFCVDLMIYDTYIK